MKEPWHMILGRNCCDACVSTAFGEEAGRVRARRRANLFRAY